MRQFPALPLEWEAADDNGGSRAVRIAEFVACAEDSALRKFLREDGKRPEVVVLPLVVRVKKCDELPASRLDAPVAGEGDTGVLLSDKTQTGNAEAFDNLRPPSVEPSSTTTIS